MLAVRPYFWLLFILFKKGQTCKFIHLVGSIFLNKRYDLFHSLPVCFFWYNTHLYIHTIHISCIVFSLFHCSHLLKLEPLHKAQSVTLNCAAVWASSIKAIALSAGSRMVFKVAHTQLHVCMSLSFITQFVWSLESKKRTGLGKSKLTYFRKSNKVGDCICLRGIQEKQVWWKEVFRGVFGGFFAAFKRCESPSIHPLKHLSCSRSLGDGACPFTQIMHDAY